MWFVLSIDFNNHAGSLEGNQEKRSRGKNGKSEELVNFFFLKREEVREDIPVPHNMKIDTKRAAATWSPSCTG